MITYQVRFPKIGLLKTWRAFPAGSAVMAAREAAKAMDSQYNLGNGGKVLIDVKAPDELIQSFEVELAYRVQETE